MSKIASKINNVGLGNFFFEKDHYAGRILQEMWKESVEQEVKKFALEVDKLIKSEHFHKK